MQELLLKIFNSQIMHYIIVPLAILFLGWVKSEHDMKEKNKELGYWMVKYRRWPTFLDITLEIYKKLAIYLLVIYSKTRALLVERNVVCLYCVRNIVFFN